MSTGTNQHWILLTDSCSIHQLNTILRSVEIEEIFSAVD